jgi:hypothetical protein
VKDYYPLLVLRLVSIICLVHLNSGMFLDILVALVCSSYIIEQLPSEFYDVFRTKPKNNTDVKVLAEIFKKIDNPLVIVSLGENCSQFLCPDAIFVDMTVKQCREDMLKVLFPETAKASQGQIGAAEVEATNSSSEVLSSGGYDQEDLNNINGSKLRVWEIFEALKSLEHGKDPESLYSNSRIMVDVEKSIHLLTTVMNERLQNTIDPVDENIMAEVASMLDELKQLSAALDVSEPELENNMSTIGELSNILLSRRPNVEPILSQLFLQQGTILVVKTVYGLSIEQCGVSKSKNSWETENKGKGNKSRKNKKNKRGSKK